MKTFLFDGKEAIETRTAVNQGFSAGT